MPEVLEGIAESAARRATLLSRLALLLALILFLALGAYQITLPGLHYDEAKEAGVNAMQIVTGQPLTAFRDAAVRLGPVELPLMVQDYIGANNVVLALPFLKLGGVNVASLRWMSLLIGALTLVFTWAVAGQSFKDLRLGGPIAAAIAALLLAVNPSFVFWSRQGIFVTNLTALALMASLFFGVRWQRNRRTFDLCATAFLWGLGLYAKLLFLWVIIGMAVIAVVAWAIESPPRRPLPRWPAWVAALICFLIPLTPLLIFNLRTSGTLSALFGNLGSSYYGVDNTAYLPNLTTRVGQLGALLRGDHFWYLGEKFSNPWAPWLAGGLIVTALILAPSGHRRSLLLPVALLMLAIAQSAFTVSDLFITHYALLEPLIPLSAGLAAAGLIRRRSVNRAAAERLLAATALAAVVGWWAADLWTTLRYHDVLHISGGYASHSDAIYPLADYLDQFEPAAPLALDWGLDAPVRYLTAGRVNPIEVFGYDRMDAPDPDFTERVSPFLDDPRSLYVAHAPDAAVFRGRVEALATLAAERGLSLIEERRFSERNGTPLFIVYRAVKE
jgi:hypothetical protein